MFSVNRRLSVTDQFWKRGSVSAGDTAVTPPPLAMVG